MLTPRIVEAIDVSAQSGFSSGAVVGRLFSASSSLKALHLIAFQVTIY
jgi:hypothetical protein